MHSSVIAGLGSMDCRHAYILWSLLFWKTPGSPGLMFFAR